MIAVILPVLAVLVVLGTVFAIEATDKGSRLWQKRWCKKHGLTMREQVTALGYGATLWWGEGADGNAYAPDADGTPVCIRPAKKGGEK